MCILRLRNYVDIFIIISNVCILLYVQFNLLHLYKYYYMQIICTIYVYDNKDIYMYMLLLIFMYTCNIFVYV